MSSARPARGRVGMTLVGVTSLVTLSAFSPLAGVASASPPATRASTGAANPSAPGLRGTRPAAKSAPNREAKVCKGCTPPLLYKGGSVAGTANTVGEITVTPIFWAPGGYSFSSGYTALIDQYLTDVAAASGGTSNVYSVNTEYYQTVGGQSTNIQYLVHAGAEQDDTNAYPTTTDANGQPVPSCTLDATSTVCVTDAQLQTELTRYLTANNLPTDISHLYPVFFPAGVKTTDGTGKTSPADYCAYHDAFGSAPNVTLYSNEPDGLACDSGQSPNGNKDADDAIDTLSHEINETITDPVPVDKSTVAWQDSAGQENADECAQDYGMPGGSTDPSNPQTTGYNQVINGHDYYTQEEFSNAGFAQVPSNGCVQSEAEVASGATSQGGTQATPQAVPQVSAQAVPQGSGHRAPTLVAQHASTAQSARPALDTVRVDASPYLLAADGSSTSAVTVHVDNPSGDPVAGDHITLNTEATTDTQGDCGTYSANTGFTNAQGDLVVTYTASTDNVACDVIATEFETGQSDQAQIAQGTAGQDAPSIDVAYPGTVTEGTPVSYTGTATNPGDALSHARFDFVIYGDDTSNQGVDASQVHLSYADSLTGGKYVAVPLSGNTTGDGEIDGNVAPDAGFTYPAGATDSLRFRLTVDPGAPTSAQTGSSLSVETDFDQVNPADASTTNLDYSVGDLTVLGVAPVAISTTSLPGATLGSPYSATVAATGGTPRYTYSLAPGSSPLPTGVSLNPATGAITGTPVVPGTSNLTVQVTDSAGKTATQALSITVGLGAGATTVTGTHQGPLQIGSGVTLINGATITGPLVIPSGAVVSVVGSHINGSLSSKGAKSLSVCSSTVTGSASVAGSRGFVLIGDAGDDGSPACGPNTFGGSLSVTNSGAGVELGANTISGSLLLSGNTGAGPDSENAAPEVEANHIGSSLVCSGNSPAPVDDHQPNTVTGQSTGQCAGLA